MGLRFPTTLLEYESQAGTGKMRQYNSKYEVSNICPEITKPITKCRCICSWDAK